MAVLGTTAVLLVGCATADVDDGDSDVLTVAADASTEAGWTRVLAAFAAGDDGRDVEVAADFGPSGGLVHGIVDGAPADLVNLASIADMDELVVATVVDEDWSVGATGGVPFGSVVSLVVREGNPSNIRDWGDLVRPGVEVVTDNPIVCGWARSNLVAPYAVKSRGGDDPDAGFAFVRRLVDEHVVSLPGAECDAAQRFVDGTGDVLITSEATGMDLAQRSGVDVVRPTETLEVEYPAAVVTGSAHTRMAITLRNFLFAEEGQTAWAESGFRPVDPGVAAEFAARFPAPDVLFTVADLGGWADVDRRLFDDDTGLLAPHFR